MYSALLAANEGCFDDIPLDKIKAAEEALFRELKKNTKLTEAINTGDKPSDAHSSTIIKTAQKVAEGYKKTDAAKGAKSVKTGAKD
jgi:F0F1-type ATP synthase alpha subunit